MHKTQVHMDSRPQYQSEHTKPDRREKGMYSITHVHRRPLPMYNHRQTGNFEYKIFCFQRQRVLCYFGECRKVNDSCGKHGISRVH